MPNHRDLSGIGSTQPIGLHPGNTRENAGLNQAEFAKKTNRRPATISDIENGKSEIRVLTLALFVITLEKPISYFSPESLLKKFVLDVKTPFEQEMVEIARGIESFGDQVLTLDLLRVLSSHFEEDFIASSTGYSHDESDVE